ncbi:hypothetical protein ACEQ8H_006042 [Pleosporales sp. CAS-2024a]
MFRADSEEKKWHIVYVILFPDTAQRELPSPYDEVESESVSDLVENHSPKAPELKQFDAFMRRELPRKVRKALELAMESRIGPVEETLKKELENIVRDCHETLTRSFLEAAQSMASSSSFNPSPCTNPEPPSTVIDLLNDNIALGVNMTMDDLSQIAVPPNLDRESWQEISVSTGNENFYPTWSEST